MTIDPKPRSLLVVGSVGLDDVETRGGKRSGVLGGAASYFSVAASFLAPPRMVAIVGHDFPSSHTELFQRHGVDLAGLERVPGETFRWAGVYSSSAVGNRQRSMTSFGLTMILPTAATVFSSPSPLPVMPSARRFGCNGP